MISRTDILANDDRRRAPLRRMRAEAERDLARRRRLMDRLCAPSPAECHAADARNLLHPGAYARGIA